MPNISIDQARTVLSDCLMVPIDRIAPSMHLQEVGQIDSLTFEMIMLEMEKCVGKEIDMVSMIRVDTVQDLADVIDEYSAI